MLILDTVLYEGRPYVLYGVTPMGIPRREAELEDRKTGERFTVPLEEVEQITGHKQQRVLGARRL